MATENLVSIKISQEDQDKVSKAISDLNDVLKPLLVSLSNDQRREIPKMGDGTEPFVEKVIDYAQSNPEFAPAYLDVAEASVDFDAVKALNSFYRPLEQIHQQLSDSIMLSGSEAYVAALAYYNSVKIATRMNVAGAKVIYEDLRQRFSKSNNRGASSGSEGLDT